MKTSKESYISIPIDKIKECDPNIPCPLYIQLGGKSEAEDQQHYAQIFSKASGIDYTRLAKYIHKGVRELYIRKEDKNLFFKFLAQKRTQEKQIENLLHSTDQILSEIFEGSQILRETAEETKRLVKKYIDTLYDRPDHLRVILKMANHGDSLYAHSLSVAVLSLFIAKNFGEFGEDFLETLTLGALYHDVGYIKLPSEFSIDLSEDEVSAEDWKKHKEHPRLGLELISTLHGIPEEVKFIVYQHHEHFDGRGYPNRLKGDSIFILSQIVCLADEYCKAHQSFLATKSNLSELKLFKVLEANKNYFHPKVFEVFAAVFIELKKSQKNAA